MIKIIGWKLWYGNGTTFSSLQGSWEKAPDQDVQVLMIYYDKKDGMGRSCRRVFSGSDYYFKDGDNFGESFDDINLVKGVVKYGKYMKTEEEFLVIQKIAMEDYSI